MSVNQKKIDLHFVKKKNYLCLGSIKFFINKYPGVRPPSPLPPLQPSERAEGDAPNPSGAAVPQPAAPGGGRVPHGAALQEGPGPQAEDPPAGARPPAAAGRALPHRGVPRGDI